MQNVKLHKLNELLENLISIDYNEAVDAYDSIVLFQNSLHLAMENYPKEHIYYKVLDKLMQIARDKQNEYFKKINLPEIE